MANVLILEFSSSEFSNEYLKINCKFKKFKENLLFSDKTPIFYIG